MKKHPLKTEVVRENTVRYTLSIESDDLDTPAKSLMQLFRDIVDAPHLLKCGSGFPSAITLRKLENSWILIATLEEQINHTMDFVEVKEEEEVPSGKKWISAQGPLRAVNY